MTYENCKKYMDEAEDKETKEFWEARIKRKYPAVLKEETSVAKKSENFSKRSVGKKVINKVKSGGVKE